MEAKDKGIYTGLGVLIGVGLGLMAFKKLKITNIGTVHLTVTGEDK